MYSALWVITLPCSQKDSGGEFFRIVKENSDSVVAFSQWLSFILP